MLSAELVNDSSQSHVRNAAGLALKNAISAKVRSETVVLTSFHGLNVTCRKPRDNKSTLLDGLDLMLPCESRSKNKHFMLFHLQMQKSARSPHSSLPPSLP